MSLLDRGNADVLVFPEVQSTDVDGNPTSGPAAEGVSARAMIQPRSAEEAADRGFLTESIYRMRLTRTSQAALGVLGAQSQVEWNGARWSLVGDAQHFNSSRRTAHYDYTLRRT